MVMSPSRLETDFDVRFATVQFEGRGRGNGSCRWEWDVDIPGRHLILASLRDKLSRCIDTLDLELESPATLLPSVPTGFQPVPVVPTSPTLWPRSPADLIARFNPILSL